MQASSNIPPPDLVPVRRALISVSDKTGLTDFAAALAGFGIELVSTGGTARAIADAGIPVRRRHARGVPTADPTLGVQMKAVGNFSKAKRGNLQTT